jgi:hypothetical protein
VRRALAGMAGAGVLGCVLAFGGGCLERTITVTSEPPGALVTLNSVEVGRTPVTTSFLYYGVYEVRLSREGYAPVWDKRNAPGPIYEYPPVDLVAEAIPAEFETNFTWHFVLEPEEAPDAPGAEDALVGRARGLREQALRDGAQSPQGTAPGPSK